MNYIGIDLGGTSIKLAKIENDSITQHIVELTPQEENQDVAIDLIVYMIKKLINQNTEWIGIGVPSVVDRKLGIVYDVQNIKGWKRVELKSILEAVFSIPVFIDNDANCFAIAEKYYGCAKSYQNIVGLTIGTGLGGGIVQEGKLLDDVNCGSGEFGEIPYRDSILEDYCASKFFTSKGYTGKEVFELAEQDSVEAAKIFNEFGYHLAFAIKIVMLTIDPEIIVLGGAISKSYKFFKEAMYEELKNFPYQNSLINLKILTSELENSALFGAVALGRRVGN
jgi:glucokinase